MTTRNEEPLKPRVARGDAIRRKAVVLAVEDDGRFMDVQWTRDNGERVSATFKLMEWQEAPRAIDEQMLKALEQGFCQISHPRR